MIAGIRVLAAGAAVALLAVPPDPAHGYYNGHPTTQVASILGNAWTLTAVPEPDATSLVAVGLLVLALRRTRTR